MSITNDQIKLYKPLYINDSLTNGGRISSVVITDLSLNNLFRNIQSSECESGITLYRKFFIKNENPDNISLENPKLYISNVSSGEDYFQIGLGTDIDNQSSADDIIDWHGSGYLNDNFIYTDSNLTMCCKQISGFPSGASLMLSDGVNQEEIVTVGVPTWNGSIATFTISGEVSFNFEKDVSVVSSIIPLNNLTPSLLNWSENSNEGSYDETTYPITLYNKTTITESWTLTFLNSTTFSVTGAVVGLIGTGDVTSNFAPVNSVGYYFNLNKSGWVGSWLFGDTITFNTVHAAQAIWVKESVPVNASSQANNLMSINLLGESA